MLIFNQFYEGHHVLTEQALVLGIQARKSVLALTDKLTSLGGDDTGARVNNFVACFDNLPPMANYQYLPLSAQHLHGRVQQRLGAQAAREFLYACLLQAIGNSLDSASFACLPSRIKGHQLKQYRRIIDNADSITEVCELDRDLFHKELGLALMRLYAAAAQLVDYRTGIGRTTLIKNGLRELSLRLAMFIRIGGFKPFFEIHTHLSYLDEFNQEGWNECYRCCADLYVLYPQVLGMYGGSWFYDPALAEISPHLGYLRDIPQQGGAYLLFDSATKQATQDAIATSVTRKNLYAEGKYRPKSYSLIWPRAAQINWVKTQDFLKST